MISLAMRSLLYVLTGGYAVLGAVLFVAPQWAAAGNFAWNVSPFVAMTIGGWCLGTAWACLIVARRGDWPAMICPILYLSLFGLFETSVLIAFRERLLIGRPLAWLYCATLAATCVFALMAAVDVMRNRVVLVALGPRMNATAVAITVSFILLVGFLGIYGLLAVPGMRGLNASIFPELLSPFSLRAFGAFYLALAIAVIPLLLARGIGNLVSHAFAMYALLIFITAAAFVFIGHFDFSARPTQLIYIGIYLLVAAAVGFYLLRYGTGAEMKHE
jgi:hypothetical protein